MTLILMVTSQGILASKPEPTLVVIVNFDCPYCQDFSQYITYLDSSMAQKKEKIPVIAPIPLKDAGNFREKFYYAVDSYDKSLGRKVLSVIFKLSKEKISLESIGVLVDWMEIEYPENKKVWEKLSKKQDLDDASLRIGKAINLGLKSGLLKLPAFILVTEEEIKLLSIEGKNMGERVEKISSKIKEYKQ